MTVDGQDGGETRIDVHQHLWPPEFIEALRHRTTPPLLRGWTLHTDGEPPYEVAPADHDPALRAELESESTRILVSLSTPLGIEALPPEDAQPLLAAWHEGAQQLGEPYAAWAAVTDTDPQPDELAKLLKADFVGLQIGAGRLADPAAVEAVAPILNVCADLDRPVLVHPGPVAVRAAGSLPWWPAVVDYPAQLQAAWWAWQAAGRSLLPGLRICFVAGAGLAPLHHERFTARGGGRAVLDRDVFVETSSYGRQAVDSLTRVLGIDVIVLGSDRPYAEPADLHLGAAARVAVNSTNPRRLLGGG